MFRHHLESELLDEELDNAVSSGRWIVSYADFVTLLFAFFVVMYSISSVNNAKFRVLSEALGEVFDKTDINAAVEEKLRQAQSSDNTSADKLDALLATLTESNSAPGNTNKEQAGQSLETMIEAAVSSRLARIHKSEDWTEIEFSLDDAFMPDSMQLSGAVEKTLGAIAQAVAGSDTAVRVEAFTDDAPREGGVYPSNRALSAAFAASVASSLVDAGLSAEQVAASAFGEAYPRANNEAASGRAANRRIVVALARHAHVPALAVSQTALAAAPETLAMNVLKRVDTLPGPLGISL